MDNDNIQKNELKKIFSERLRSLKGNMKLIELESITGIIRQNLSKYLVGKALPNSENLAILADIFNVSCDYLLGRDDNIVYGTDYLTKETGLDKESLKALKELTSNNNNFLTLFAINKIISLPSGREFLQFYSKYVSAPNLDKVKNDPFYYFAFPTYRDVFSNNIDIPKCDDSYDEMVYYFLLKKFQDMTNDIKKNEKTHKELKSCIDEIIKNSSYNSYLDLYFDKT